MYKIIKRSFDILSSILLFALISPLFLILMLLVRINMGKPIFFRQERTTIYKKRFYLIKFRSMNNHQDADGNLLPDHLRVSRFGIWLRSTSLDELPELLNIIKGDMSVIGPRPLPCSYDAYYSKEEENRFKVRGGLISPDTIEMEPVVSWDKQLQVESDYGTRVSFVYDLKIFLGVFKVLKKRSSTNFGAYERVALEDERKCK